MLALLSSLRPKGALPLSTFAKEAKLPWTLETVSFFVPWLRLAEQKNVLSALRADRGRSLFR